MTRLRSADIAAIVPELAVYDERLRTSTGCSLLEIACLSAGTDPAGVAPLVSQTRVSCVTMTCGMGRIQGFAECLAGIARHLGFSAGVTLATDAAGWAEAYEKEQDVVLAADDGRFVAVNTKTRQVADNSEATGKGFAVALHRLAGGVENQSVLILGCGPVGQSACRTLLGLKAVVSLFDIDKRRCLRFFQAMATEDKSRIRIETDLDRALRNHRFLLDATPASDIIDENVITNKTRVSAPGVPCGVTHRGRQILSGRLISDPLEIGVATMLIEALIRKKAKEKE